MADITARTDQALRKTEPEAPAVDNGTCAHDGNDRSAMDQPESNDFDRKDEETADPGESEQEDGAEGSNIPAPEATEPERAAAQGGSGDPDQTAAQLARSRWSRWFVAVVGLLAVVLFVLMTVSVILAVDVRQELNEETEREDATQAARQGIINLTTIDHNTADRDVKRLLEGTTGQFKKDFTERSNDFVDLVKQSKVVSSGDIREIGIEKKDEKSVRVLVAAQAQVRNSAAPEGEPRDYRLAVTLEKQDNRWLISNVEFVP
ncbi:MAG: hypothetical protein GEV13_35465 [Rhodospirillales bacterium]|nr:hypothetical protein [Rhodospirillales bacterium]